MKTYSYLVLFAICISACKPGIPKDIIQPDQMALVLNDVHIADGLITTVQPDSAKIVAASFYNGIYKKFKIDSAIFYKSMDYYYRNPVIMDEIYKDVTASLLKQRLNLVRVDSLKNAAISKKADRKKAADSIRKTDSLLRVMLKKREDSVKRLSSVKAIDSLKKAAAKKKKKIKRVQTKKKLQPKKV
ncbi:MAG: DUF4296 domain-containing protein [Bacteroidota bacterium]